MQKPPIGEVPSTDLVRAPTVVVTSRRAAMEFELERIKGAAMGFVPALSPEIVSEVRRRHAEKERCTANRNLWRTWALTLFGSVVGGILLGNAFNVPSAEASQPPVCKTACGAEVHGSPNGCEELSRYERRVLRAFESKNPEWDLFRTCRTMQLYTYRVVTKIPELGQYTPSGMVADGVTDISTMTVYLRPHATWEESSFAHETLHVIRAQMDGKVDGHFGWEEKGYNRMLSRLGPSSEGSVVFGVLRGLHQKLGSYLQRQEP